MAKDRTITLYVGEGGLSIEGQLTIRDTRIVINPGGVLTLGGGVLIYGCEIEVQVRSGVEDYVWLRGSGSVVGCHIERVEV